MTDLATIDQNPQQPPAKPARQFKITRQVRTAIEAMVWEGLKRSDAASHAGMKDNSLYVALRRPDVKAFYRSELEVLRESERARNIHTLVDVRDQKTNQMARVQAVKALEQISDDATVQSGASHSPGITIRIVNVTQDSKPVVDVSPNRLAHD